MAARLQAIADRAETVNVDEAANMVFGTNQPWLIPVLREMVASARDPMERYSLRRRLAAQLLQAGLSQEALQELDSLQTAIADMPPTLASPQHVCSSHALHIDEVPEAHRAACLHATERRLRSFPALADADVLAMVGDAIAKRAAKKGA